MGIDTNTDSKTMRTPAGKNKFFFIVCTPSLKSISCLLAFGPSMKELAILKSSIHPAIVKIVE
jgi:hypothetical protein